MDSHIYICAKNGKIALNFFTQNALVIQENCAKMACYDKPCTDSQICENCTEVMLHNFAVFSSVIKYCICSLFVLFLLFCFFISAIALVVNQDILYSLTR